MPATSAGRTRRHHATMDTRGRLAMKLRRKVARPVRHGLAKALDSTKPFARRPVGLDARMLLIMSRVLPTAGVHHGDPQ